MKDLDAKLAADARELFPSDLLGPWFARCLPELGEEWEASMLPLVEGTTPVFTLRRVDAVRGTSVETRLSGSDQDALVALARDFHAPR